MKKIIKNKTYFLTITLVLSLKGFFFQTNSTTLYAQSDILLSSHWSLLEGNVNGEIISAEDLGNSNFYFLSSSQIFVFRYGVTCSEFINSPLSNVTEDSFSLDPIQEFNSCSYSDPDEIASVNLHKSLFFELPIDEIGNPKNPFSYELIETIYDDYELLVTNVNGDWALYQRPQLNIEEFSKIKFSIYPNPVKETLHINNGSNQNVTTIIYDVSGKALLKHFFEGSSESMDVKALNPGLYFVVFESETGERVSKKFVKK